MEAAFGALKGLLILGSCLLLSSGALLPKLDSSGRFWKHEPPQYPSSEGSINLKNALNRWGICIPSITLRDWSLEWMSSDVLAPQKEGSEGRGQNRQPHLWMPTRKEALSPRKRTLYSAGWMPGWDEKRGIVVADDAAFREKSKMLTAMERQKWLNSYMQKFLVVNSK